MEEKSPNEELINKLIKKRKLENDAFAKLLNAMKNKNTPLIETDHGNGKQKK